MFILHQAFLYQKKVKDCLADAPVLQHLTMLYGGICPFKSSDRVEPLVSVDRSREYLDSQGNEIVPANPW